MAINAKNLPSAEKERLRRAVLTEIGAEQSEAASPPAAVKAAPAPINRPASKTLRKIEFKSDLLAGKPAKDEEVKPQRQPSAAIAVKKASKVIKNNMPVQTNPLEEVQDKTVKKKAGGKTPKRPAKTAGIAAAAAKKPAAKAKKTVKSASRISKASGRAFKETKSPAVSPKLATRKVFKPQAASPVYESEAIEQAVPAGFTPEKKALKPKFGFYRSDAKNQISVKDESLEKLFQTSPKVQKARQAAMARVGGELKVKKKGAWGKVLLGLVIALVLLLGLDVFGLYQLHFSDPLSRQIALIAPLPAGQIDGETISLNDYLNNQAELSLALTQGREGVKDYSGKTEINDKVFYYLATEKLVEQKLAQYSSIVTDQTVEEQAQKLVAQAGSAAAAEQMVENLYGMSLADFKRNVLKPMLEREALLSAIMDDDSVAVNAAAKTKANQILAQALATSSNFAALAKQYSDDESSVNLGGDLGWVSKGQLNSAWEPLVFSAATGTVVNSLIKSDYGYHIIKVEQKVTDKATGAVSVKLRHILVQVDVDQYIKDLVAAADINQYVK